MAKFIFDRGLVWFRSDLRVFDNPALTLALKECKEVTAIYFDCPEQWQSHNRSAFQTDFIEKNLNGLGHSLAQLAVSLKLETVSSFKALPNEISRLVDQSSFNKLYASNEPGLNEKQRDAAVAHQLTIPQAWFYSDCLLTPGSILNQQGLPYQVFTPYRNQALKALIHDPVRCLPVPNSITGLKTFSALKLSGSKKPSGTWKSGESSASEVLQRFCQRKLVDYSDIRDFPHGDHTSQLSPYLALGVLSPKQVIAEVIDSLGGLPQEPSQPGFSWVNEVLWREFYRHIMYANPDLSKGLSYQFLMKGDSFKEVQWQWSSENFEAWCKGLTGFPLVDAAMRCLNQTGWMHNRLRMVVASFLTKDLHIDWRLGEKYFMSQLIDGDHSANNGGWQWASGTGADAAPYFRIFNPYTQSKKFDPDGAFIRTWVPELANLNHAEIHQPPTQNSGALFSQAYAYPEPIVDHSIARKTALELNANRK